MREIDPKEILRVVDQINETFEASLNEEGQRARDERRHGDDGPADVIAYPAVHGDEAMYDFELSTAVEALRTLADDIQAECDRKMAMLYDMALDGFYKLEELSRDPEHSDLIPEVERIRAAHMRDYGKPIPPKKSE